MKFLHISRGGGGLPGRGNGGQKRRDFGPGKSEIDPKATQDSPLLTQIGPGLARESLESTPNSPFLTPNSPLLIQIGPKKPGSDRGWLVGAWGGIFWGKGGVGVGSDSFGRREIFGLLNFCCTREACFIWEVFSVSHPLTPPTHALFGRRAPNWRGRGIYIFKII